MRDCISSLVEATLSLLLWCLGLLHFALALLLILPLIEIFGARRIFPLARFVCRSQLLSMGCPLKVEGSEHLPKDGPYLLLGNHESLFDIFAIIGAMPSYVTALEAAPHFRYPIWGHILRRWGIIPLPEGQIHKAMESLEEARRRLVQGERLVVLPEGHRSRTGNLGPLKKGAFRLALEAPVPVVPFVLEGLYEFQNVHSWRLHPRKLVVRFCPAVSPENFQGSTAGELRERFRVILEDAILGKC